MFVTYLVYSLLLIIGVVGSKIIISTNKFTRKQRNFFIAIFLFIISIPIGGRFEVGTDWENYCDLFNHISQNGLQIREIFQSNYEPLYLMWNRIISCISPSSSLFFTCNAFLIFFLLYKSTRGYEHLFPLVLFFFFCSMFGASMNITRQVLSITIFYFAIVHSDSKLKMSILILLAILTHYSSAILIITLIINNKTFKILDNSKIVVLIYLFCYVCGTHIYTIFIEYLPINIMSDKYISSVNSEGTFKLSSGLGVAANTGINLMLMITSTKVRAFFLDKKIDLLYRSFFIGCFLSAFMGYSIFLSRLPLGLTSLKIFLLTYTVYYLSNKSSLPKFALKSIILILYILFFIMSIHNSDNGCSPYKFDWL